MYKLRELARVTITPAANPALVRLVMQGEEVSIVWQFVALWVALVVVSMLGGG